MHTSEQLTAGVARLAVMAHLFLEFAPYSCAAAETALSVTAHLFRVRAYCAKCTYRCTAAETPLSRVCVRVFFFSRSLFFRYTASETPLSRVCVRAHARIDVYGMAQ